MLPDLVKSHPEILAILIALLGFLVAGLLSRLLDRWWTSLEGYLRHRAPARLEHFDLKVLRQVLRAILYYGTLFLFLLTALQTLRISVAKEWISVLLLYVPQLILGALIILCGYLASVVIRSLLAKLMGVSSDNLAPRFAQLLIITTAVLTGLAQTSINISFISNVMVMLLAFFFGGLSLAFALGSRPLVENLLARRAMDRYRIGDTVRIRDAQGKIIEILSTAVVLETEQGLLTVPTAAFVTADTLLIKNEERGDDGAA
jgi:small-conductance mechanosensitive channel